jgi:NAD(P)-dependent dehydrogenase (short-subunit alcohol dehydrogenase family)
MLKPDGRVIMISGASRGIGRAIAEHLYGQGYSVSLGVRDPGAAAAQWPHVDASRLLHHRFDAEDRASFAPWVQATLAHFGRLDGLVNNAGISNRFSIEAGDEADLDRIIAVNVKAPLFLTRLCLPHLRASGTGRIVNIGSLSGKRVRNDNIAYAMSKFALMALTHGTRRIGWEDGVRVTAVCPSFVATDLTSAVTRIARESMIAASDLAELVGTALALPNNAAVAELLVNCTLEDML